MKKVLVVLLLLAVAGGLFAQSLTWTGSVGTGIFFKFGDSFDDPIAYADDDDANVPVRANLNAAYDAGAWGIEFGSRADFASDAAQGVVFYNAHGWMKFLNDMITVRAGKIDKAVWNTKGDVDENLSNDLGIRVEVTPIDGLNIGALFSYPTLGAGVAAGTIGNWFGETVFGAQYVASNFWASAALKLYSEESDIGFTFDETTGTVTDDVDALVGKRTVLGETDMKLIFGAGFTGVANLEILVNGAVEGLGDYSEVGLLTVAEEARYTMGALKFGAVLREWMSGNSDVGFFMAKLKPLVEYAVNDQVTVGADVPITVAKNSDDAFALAQIALNAWGKYTLGGSWVKAGYGFTKDTEDPMPTDDLNHYVKVIFGYSF